jgi:hypothetical protein
LKINAHRQREKVEIVNAEIEEYQRRASGSRSNHIQVDEQVRIMSQEIDELNMFLSGLTHRTKHQQTMLEAMQNERDLACRQLQLAIAEMETKTVENNELTITIRRMKDEIRDKDKLVLVTHMSVQTTYADTADLTKRSDELQRQIAATDDFDTELRNKIQRSLFLISQAELDSLKQKQVVTDLDFKLLSLNVSVTNRATEVEALKQKIHTISGIITMGNMAFRKQAEELEKLRGELAAEVARKKLLTKNVHHRRALQLEEIRVMKGLLMERGRCRGLEDELEKPLNVHRWRFLDGTNPQLAQMIKMNHELRDRLMLKLMVLVRLRAAKKAAKKNAAILDSHLSRSYNGNINEEFTFLNDVLRQKTRQLAAIQEQVMGQNGTVSEHKGHVLTIRTMVREEKEEFYGTKQKLIEFRSPTALEKSRSKIVEETDGREHRFIGGGFAVAGMIKKQLEENGKGFMSPAQKKSAVSALVSPQIIHPRSVSTLQKRQPRGWNQNRPPLNSILPTVSGSP